MGIRKKKKNSFKLYDVTEKEIYNIMPKLRIEILVLLVVKIKGYII